MIQTYRGKQKGTIIDAVKLTADNVEEVSAWCRGVKVIEHDAFDKKKKLVGLNVPTTTDVFRVSEGEYVVKLHKKDEYDDDQFYKAMPERFEANFEVVS